MQTTEEAVEEKNDSEVNDESNVNPPGTLPIVKKPITLTVGISQSSAVEDWETNKQTLYMEEKTNINLNYESNRTRGFYRS